MPAAGRANFITDNTVTLFHSEKTKDGRKITDDYG